MLEELCDRLKAAFPDATVRGNGLDTTIDCSVEHYVPVLKTLRDDESFAFEQLMDLCGVDYSNYEGQQVPHPSLRFAVVCHLLSVSRNQRIRVRTFAPSNDFPVVPSVVDLWNSANWYEREAFDMFGILFDGHPDLRRILTDYGFVGHPLRKDFPLSGEVEMHYDVEAGRVIYRPITIEPREITPRIVREPQYGNLGGANGRH